jgi:Cdc6-like AAA superfamily ATPase
MATDVPAQQSDSERAALLAAAAQQRRQELALKIGQAFSPSAPVSTQALFAGRTRQMSDLMSVIAQPGRHAVIYGERGVGKTSLAAVMAILVQGTTIAARTNCDGTDSYSSVWRKALDEIVILRKFPAFGFSDEVQQAIATAASELPTEGDISPNDVKNVLRLIGSVHNIVVFIDEFDRLEDSAARALFADTVKTLSDQLVPATIVLVGVADNVEELIQEHPSVERAVAQIRMPRMSEDELAEIVTRGVASIPMGIERNATHRITDLSQGLPHYTHLLAQAAAQAAVEHDAETITLEHVHSATERAINQAEESIISAYHRAVMSTRPTLYRQVVLACALAKGDDLGYFAAADVREPLSSIMKKFYDIPTFSPHLNALSEKPRGQMLQKIGSTRKFRFRFRSPLLQPYVIMRGLADGQLDVATLERFSPSAFRAS